MAERITDEAFDAMPLSQQLEFVASHLHESDEASVGNLKCWDISNMLMHALVMARKAAALEHELQQRRDDERLQLLRLETAFEQSDAHTCDVMGWPVIARNVRGTDTPKRAA
ncbi:MAG: hypothetical protein COB08_003260 [Rhodobacteraceae bacterium]|nr:hypothetical protein [Paracoccaceae bacterium]